jgi:hypothetical protein
MGLLLEKKRSHGPGLCWLLKRPWPSLTVANGRPARAEYLGWAWLLNFPARRRNIPPANPKHTHGEYSGDQSSKKSCSLSLWTATLQVGPIRNIYTVQHGACGFHACFRPQHRSVKWTPIQIIITWTWTWTGDDNGHACKKQTIYILPRVLSLFSRSGQGNDILVSQC